MNLYPACRKVPVISWQPLTWSQTSFVQEHSNWHSFPYDGKGHGFVQLFPQKPFSHATTEITKRVDPSKKSPLFPFPLFWNFNMHVLNDTPTQRIRDSWKLYSYNLNSIRVCLLSLLLSSKLMDIKKLFLLLMLDKFVVFSRHTRVLDLAPRVFEYPKWWARECEWSQLDNMMAYFCPPPVHLNMKHDYGNRRLFMSTCEIDRMST